MVDCFSLSFQNRERSTINYQLIRPKGEFKVDPIANMLTIIRNGYLAHKPSVTFSISKFKFELAKVLESQKYIGKVQKKDKNLIRLYVYQGVCQECL